MVAMTIHMCHGGICELNINCSWPPAYITAEHELRSGALVHYAGGSPRPLDVDSDPTRPCHPRPGTLPSYHGCAPAPQGPCRMARHNASPSLFILTLSHSRLSNAEKAHDYLPPSTPCLHSLVPSHLVPAWQLCDVCVPEVRTISGTTLHHLAMAHQRYFNWAAMVAYYM